MRFRAVGIAGCLGIGFGTMAQTPLVSGSAMQNAPHLRGDRISLPLTIVKGFPFIEGSINAKRGKLLFDVGEGDALSVDNHTVTVPNAKVIGRGSFGSGQTYEVSSLPLVDSLTLASELRFEHIGNVRGTPGLPLEQHITPDFIGWIGVPFWKGYVFRLDYNHPSVTFFSNAEGVGEQTAESGEAVLQKIKLDEGNKRDLLSLMSHAGEQPIPITLDTGSHNAAWLNDGEIAALTRSGHMTAIDKDGKATISGLTVDRIPIPPMRYEITKGRAPFAKLLSAPEGPLLQFGYEFLHRYKTVWNYDANTLTLLKP